MRWIVVCLVFMWAGVAVAADEVNFCAEPDFEPFDPTLEDFDSGFSKAETCRQLIDEANAKCTGRRCMGCLNVECNCGCATGDIGCMCFVFAEACPDNNEPPDCDEQNGPCFFPGDPFSDDRPDPRDGP